MFCDLIYSIEKNYISKVRMQQKKNIRKVVTWVLNKCTFRKYISYGKPFCRDNDWTIIFKCDCFPHRRMTCVQNKIRIIIYAFHQRKMHSHDRVGSCSTFFLNIILSSHMRTSLILWTQCELINFLLLVCQSDSTVIINHQQDYDNSFSPSPPLRLFPSEFDFRMYCLICWRKVRCWNARKIKIWLRKYIRKITIYQYTLYILEFDP